MNTTPLDPRPIAAISLDLDDTLWPVAPTIHRAEQQLLAWLREQAPATAVLAAQPEQARAARAAALAARPDLQHDLTYLRRESIRHLLRAAGDDPDLAEPAFEVFFDWRQRVDLFDDVQPALARLAARYRLVAVSNGNADVVRVGLGPYFSAAISARSVGVAKPDPAIFATAARALGLPMQSVLHVGDDPALDVVAAQAAGQQPVWINRGAQRWPEALPPPAVQVRDLLELADRLGA